MTEPAVHKLPPPPEHCSCEWLRLSMRWLTSCGITVFQGQGCQEPIRILPTVLMLSTNCSKD